MTQQRTIDDLRAEIDQINRELLALISRRGEVVAQIGHAKSAEGALSEPVAGFLYVTAVDAHTGAVTVLAPCGGSLPGRVAVAGNIKVFLE